MPLISFVFSSWIINEYYKYIYIYIVYFVVTTVENLNLRVRRVRKFASTTAAKAGDTLSLSLSRQSSATRLRGYQGRSICRWKPVAEIAGACEIAESLARNFKHGVFWRGIDKYVQNVTCALWHDEKMNENVWEKIAEELQHVTGYCVQGMGVDEHLCMPTVWLVNHDTSWYTWSGNQTKVIVVCFCSVCALSDLNLIAFSSLCRRRFSHCVSHYLCRWALATAVASGSPV